MTYTIIDLQKDIRNVDKQATLAMWMDKLQKIEIHKTVSFVVD